MKRIYVGMDAHSSFCTLVTVDSEGRELDRKDVKTSEKELTFYFKHLKEKWGQRKLRLTFEETELSRWLYSFLAPLADDVIVANPTYITRKTQKKNDYIDALHLARELRAGNLVGVFHDEHNKYLELRSLVSGYEDIIDAIVKTKCRFKSVFGREGRRPQGQKIFGDESPETVLESETNRFAARAHLDHLARLLEIKERYLERFEKNKNDFPMIKNLATVPGLGTIRANVVASIVCDAKRFKNKHHFWSYCSLVSHAQVSAGKFYGSKNSRGRSDLKSVFINAAQNIMSISKTSYGAKLVEFYEKKHSSDPKTVRRNIARKLAAISLSVMRREAPFLAHYEDKKVRKEKTDLETKTAFLS